MKVRYIEETGHCLTNGKSYKVLREYDNRYKIKDDDGDEISGLKNCFKTIPSKQLKVGDVLLVKDLTDWCEVGKNYYAGEWQVSSGIFYHDRTIDKIEIKDGHKAFLVSGTANVWIRAKGYRKFCERNVTKETSMKDLELKELELKDLELKEAIEILKHFQQWRTGGVEHFAYSGNQLTEAINLIIEENEK